MHSCCTKLFHCKILLCLRKERLHIPTLFVDLLSTPAFLVPTPVPCSRITRRGNGSPNHVVITHDTIPVKRLKMTLTLINSSNARS